MEPLLYLPNANHVGLKYYIRASLCYHLPSIYFGDAQNIVMSVRRPFSRTCHDHRMVPSASSFTAIQTELTPVAFLSLKPAQAKANSTSHLKK